MSLPFDAFSEPPPVPAFDNGQYDASRDDLDSVIRIWLSSIRPNYRRSIRGRSSIDDTQRSDRAVAARGRHRAPASHPARILGMQVGRPDGRVGGTPRTGNDSAEERPGSVEQGGG